MTTPTPTTTPAKTLTLAERDALHKARNHLGLRTGKLQRAGTWHVRRS